jgi:hypothetical protein
MGFTTDEVRVIDNGDDCVVIISRENYAKILRLTGQEGTLQRLAIVDPANWQRVYIATFMVKLTTHMPVELFYHRLGFTLKEEGFTDVFEHIDFCQTRPCFIDGRWIMVRNLAALSKDCICLKEPGVFRKWCAQMKTAGLASYGSTPIYSSFYRAFPGTTTADLRMLQDSGFGYLTTGMISADKVSIENRVAFYNTFGVSPREQEVIEQLYRQTAMIEFGKLDVDNPVGDPHDIGMMFPLN